MRAAILDAIMWESCVHSFWSLLGGDTGVDPHPHAVDCIGDVSGPHISGIWLGPPLDSYDHTVD